MDVYPYSICPLPVVTYGARDQFSSTEDPALCETEYF